MTERGDKAAQVCGTLPILALMVWGEAKNPREATLALGNDATCYILRGASLKSEPLARLLSSQQLKVAYDAKSAQRILAFFGVKLDYIIDIGANDALIVNGAQKPGDDPFPQWYELVRKSISKLPREGSRTYGAPPPRTPTDELAAGELALCYETFLSQVSRIKALDLATVSQIEGNAAPALGDIEYAGIHIDVAKLDVLIKDLRDKNKNYQSKLDAIFSPLLEKDLFGKVEVSYDNDSQVQNLAKKLGVKIFNFKKESLLDLNHPLGELLWNFRETGRQFSLFTKFKEFLDDQNRVHPLFHAFGAATGRIAVSNPNVQGIPKDDFHRRVFSAPEGRVIITADYATFEMRILAQASGDPKLIASLAEGKDFHSAVASAVFKTEVTREKNPLLRSRAKVMNFGVCYGMTPQGLARELRLSLAEAEELLNRYFAAMPLVKSYLEESAETALRTGESRTLSGRRLVLNVPNATDETEKAQAVRIAKNMPIQGTNADILKIALARLRRAFAEKSPQSKVINCIHDEIVVEAPEESAEESAEILREQMIKAAERFITVVPIEVDVKTGNFWGGK
ncbi:MAG: hypothetical protein Kow0090_05510 [Myxococcota bacterium]